MYGIALPQSAAIYSDSIPYSNMLAMNIGTWYPYGNKLILKHIGVCTSVVVLNKTLAMVLDAFSIQCLWGILCMWIFMDSLVLCMEVREIEAERDAVLRIHNKEQAYHADTMHDIKQQFAYMKVMAQTITEHHEELLQAIKSLHKDEEFKLKRKPMTKQDSFYDLFVGTKYESTYVVSICNDSALDKLDLHFCNKAKY